MSEHINRSNPGEMPRYHVTNAAAAAHIKDGARLLCAMWEDGNLDAWEDAQHLGHWLEKVAPGVFVLVDTWDNVTAPCNRAEAVRAGGDEYERHYGCDYYNPDYRLFLVPRSVWDAVKAECAAMWDAHQAEHVCQVSVGVGRTP